MGLIMGVLFFIDGNSQRELIVGPRDCGKVNIIFALILHANELRWKYKYFRSVIIISFIITVA